MKEFRGLIVECNGYGNNIGHIDEEKRLIYLFGHSDTRWFNFYQFDEIRCDKKRGILGLVENNDGWLIGDSDEG